VKKSKDDWREQRPNLSHRVKKARKEIQARFETQYGACENAERKNSDIAKKSVLIPRARSEMVHFLQRWGEASKQPKIQKPRVKKTGREVKQRRVIRKKRRAGGGNPIEDVRQNYDTEGNTGGRP